MEKWIYFLLGVYVYMDIGTITDTCVDRRGDSVSIYYSKSVERKGDLDNTSIAVLFPNKAAFSI